MHPTKLANAKPNPTALGQLLVSGGFITASTLQQALSTQRWSQRRLGDVLVQRHELSNIEKQAVLKLQKTLKEHTHAIKENGEMPQSLQLSLGQLLVENGEITHQQLNAALAEHSLQHRRLGEILIDQQLISPSRLACWLQLQKKLFSAAAVAAWIMTSSGNVAAGENQQNLWQKFISGNLIPTSTTDTKHAWGQQSTDNLPRLSIKHRDLSELSRSRDGTLSLRFGQKGLNIVKRF
ncbi:MAG: hypothetical protein P1U47_12300 [Zhongshania sp.]|uniref:hypothetical protein n=1 Tax=Zhongshania sp. TaxID=1971902 RepID=UPI0026091DC2|nr:hypothetical protein [Zhongshania sp.]MDF1693152.1 hypothetical protein [Zhongshania sp.]